MKALGVGLGAFPFADVEVVRHGLDAAGAGPAGRPPPLAGRPGVARWHLSLTHTDQVAVALVVAEGRRWPAGSGGDPVAAAGTPKS